MSEARKPLLSRWLTFVIERFSPLTHVPMIGAFTVANILMGVALNRPAIDDGYLHGFGNPGYEALSGTRAMLAFVLAISFFLRLRVFDEIKDYATDLKVNPTRPLARGLISIKEAKAALVALFAFEIALLALLSPVLVASHLLAMGYSLLMYREFFAGDFLRPHLTTYATLHTFSSVLIGASIVGVVTDLPFWEFSRPMGFLLLANWGYFNLFEFARKTFAPDEERPEVESYSKIFSVPGAVALSLSQAVFPLIIVHNTVGADFSKDDNIVLWGLLVLIAGPAFSFILRRRAYGAKMFRAFVGLYLILGYLALAWVLT
jgi:4-hydroxybenzoate polyprenyltransferase